jgi:hypothetical protein
MIYSSDQTGQTGTHLLIAVVESEIHGNQVISYLSTGTGRSSPPAEHASEPSPGVLERESQFDLTLHDAEVNTKWEGRSLPGVRR